MKSFEEFGILRMREQRRILVPGEVGTDREIKVDNNKIDERAEEGRKVAMFPFERCGKILHIVNKIHELWYDTC